MRNHCSLIQVFYFTAVLLAYLGNFLVEDVSEVANGLEDCDIATNTTRMQNKYY